MRTVRGILFDVDDTLFDRDLAQRMVLEVIMNRFPGLFKGISQERALSAFLKSDQISNDEYEAGLPGNQLRNRRTEIFLDLLGLSSCYASEITEIYVNEYPSLDAPILGAKKLISELKPHFTLGIISNGLPDVQYKKLEALGILPDFECIVLSEVLGVAKPNPQIFGHALSLLSMRPDEVLYVGDSYSNDVIGAIGAGLYMCWFNPTELKLNPSDSQPTYQIRELSELKSIVN